MSHTFGDALYRDVQAYGARPSHRTGTDDDHATLAWLTDNLRRDGARVEADEWTFPRWDAQWSAELDGQVIDALPVFYEATGSFGPNAIQVVATPHAGGLLTVKNRHALATPAEAVVVTRPTLHIASRYAGREAEVHAHIADARITEGRSANLIATYGCTFEQAKVLIATPVSGWFSCASERGTGIAIARQLAAQLAAQGQRVALLATSGHELFNLGLEHHLATRAMPRATLIHIGASVAAKQYGGEAQGQPLTPAATLSDSLYVTTNRPGGALALSSLGFHAQTDESRPKRWIGEGTRWCTQGRPLLSVAGISHWFHTPQDTADLATDPALLAKVAEAVQLDVLNFIAKNETK
jgi:hypothetical protein